MLDPILRLLPHARVGFIGLKRNEHTLEAATYHKSLPEDLSSFEIILMDPMLATGGSAVSALGLVAERKAIWRGQALEPVEHAQEHELVRHAGIQQRQRVRNLQPPPKEDLELGPRGRSRRTWFRHPSRAFGSL